MGWRELESLDKRTYICGHCNTKVTTDIGYENSDNFSYLIYICPCGMPTFFDDYENLCYPSHAFGNEISGIPSGDVLGLYTEARLCTSAQAYTAAVLACRKLLMHIAVEKKAPVGQSFIQYVEYLSEKNYVPPDGKKWVDYIRKKGNEANHEIILMTEEDAKDLINFTEMLLKFVYEFPSKIRSIEESK